MSKERDVVLGHGDEADGIEEYDNALPAWWLGLFYFTIAWGVVYGIHYHFVGMRSQVSEYDAEMLAANEKWPQKDIVVTASDITPEAVDAGAQIYASSCVGCHGPELKGGIGPDLTDATWIHGGSIEAINKTITEGVPDKGMITWGPILGPQKVAQVAAFIYQKSQSSGAAPTEPPSPAGAP